MKNKVLKKRLFVFIFFIFSLSLFASKNFIVTKEAESMETCSKNKLKQSLGDSMRDALYNCADLSKQVGKIQVELSEIQKQLFEKVEKLIDNQIPFKKADKKSLVQALNITNKLKAELNVQASNIKELVVQINNNNCLKKEIT